MKISRVYKKSRTLYNDQDMESEMYIDTHTHIDMVMRETGADESGIVNAIKENNIVSAVQVSISADNLQWSYDFAARNRDRGFLFTLGIHPSSKAGQSELESLERIVAHAVKTDPDLLFGIGECGLDFFRMRQEKQDQIESFLYQIGLSKKAGLPLVIHVRDAMKESLDLLASQSPVWGILHCFSGSRAEAKKALDLGFFISFAGNVTYRNAALLQDSAAYVPVDRILVETDAPFLTPVPLRGKKNRTEYIVHTYAYLAQLKNMKLQALMESVALNFLAVKNRSFIK